QSSGSNRLPLLGTIRPEICEEPRLISQFQHGAKGSVVGMRSLHSILKKQFIEKNKFIENKQGKQSNCLIKNKS
ncbi:hypothetical protein, partial [Xenorhabdus khoisanae]|uniref:hypothetical protein n=1 Tax=Xenorhabdus khoisanae TaxID=880157 RepID=UPI001F2B8552